MDWGCFSGISGLGPLLQINGIIIFISNKSDAIRNVFNFLKLL